MCKHLDTVAISDSYKSLQKLSGDYIIAIQSYMYIISWNYGINQDEIR